MSSLSSPFFFVGTSKSSEFSSRHVGVRMSFDDAAELDDGEAKRTDNVFLTPWENFCYRCVFVV